MAVPYQPGDERLSRISTQWSLIYQAHWGGEDAAAAAQCQFVQRYCGAVYRYLLGALRNEDAAEDLFQEFALRFVRGDFRRADPQRGRFRDYLKTALVHLITDHHRRKKAEPRTLPDDYPDSLEPLADADTDAAFAASWREELINQTWQALERNQPTYYRVLLWHVEHPESNAAEMGQQLAANGGQPMTAGHLRVTLHRARARFAELLVAEVAQSMGNVAPDQLAMELRELHLMPLCEEAFARWQPALQPFGQPPGGARSEPPAK